MHDYLRFWEILPKKKKSFSLGPLCKCFVGEGEAETKLSTREEKAFFSSLSFTSFKTPDLSYDDWPVGRFFSGVIKAESSAEKNANLCKKKGKGKVLLCEPLGRGIT